MEYLVGQKALYTSVTGKQRVEVIIYKRAIDYKNGVIKELNFSGNFDYLVIYKNNDTDEYIFCRKDDLSPIN